MLLGIDVGGTYTDAVLISEGKIRRQAKVLTDNGHILQTILAALDEILQSESVADIERVALSTTLVTNAIIAGQTDPVALVLLPGPGADWRGRVPCEPVVLQGYVDHRGRERQEIDEAQLQQAVKTLAVAECLAVSGKFSVRNPEMERRVADRIHRGTGAKHITCGAEVAGGLNFIRRTNSAYYNSAVWKRFRVFAEDAAAALAERGLVAPVFVLKADGGTLPLAKARELPVESIFTGPAASVLGVMALCRPLGPAVSVDIGGTTTDIALWKNGVPLFDEKGAVIAGYLTAVRAFRLKSIGLGGDSWVRRNAAGKLQVGPERKGQAMALGGPAPTVTDALIASGKITIGDNALAGAAMLQVAFPGKSAVETAMEILETASETVKCEIDAMLAVEADTPVYRVEDIVRGERFVPETLIGVGGGAQGLTPLVARKMGVSWIVPEHAMVANAAGAALARPTLDITLRVDTALGEYTAPELGLRRALSGRGFSIGQAREAAAGHLRAMAEAAGIEAVEIESVQEEEFNIVRGFNTTGKIITVRAQVKPGVLEQLAGAGRSEGA